MIEWIKSLFGKKEEIVGRPNDAWRAFVKYTMEESRRISKGKDLEAELIREIDNLSDSLDKIRSLAFKIRRQKEDNKNENENNDRI